MEVSLPLSLSLTLSLSLAGLLSFLCPFDFLPQSVVDLFNVRCQIAQVEEIQRALSDRLSYVKIPGIIIRVLPIASPSIRK